MITLTTSYQLIKQTYLGNNGYGGDIYVRTYAKYSTQDIANNTTTMQVQTRIYSGGTWWASSGTGHTTTANGVTKSGMNLTYDWSMWAVGETTIETLETTVQHANDGTKSLSVSSYFYSEPWGWYGTAEDTVALPTIPRASKLTSATMTIANNGGSITVKPMLTKNVNTFYDCLVIQDNGTTIVTLDGVTNNTNKSLSSSQITTVFNSIGTATSKTFTCYLATYSDSSKTTLIGNSTNVNLTATLPTYSISITASVADSVSTYNTYKPNSSTYIANLSKPTFTFSATSSTGSYYGRSVAFTLNDATVTSPYTVNNYTGQSFTLKATDGRKTATNTPSMTHVSYFVPTLKTTVTRTTPTGSTIDISVTGTYYKGTGLTNLLTPSLTFRYTESGGSQQSTTITLTTSTSGDVVTFNGTKQLTGMNYQKSMTWSAVITDRIGVTQTNSNVLSQGLPVWNAYRKNDINYFRVNGEIDGQLIGTKGGTWIKGRENAVVRSNSSSTSSGTYCPVISQKTNAGNWTIGALMGDDNLTFDYTTDTDYNNSSNTHSRVYITSGGNFSGNANNVVQKKSLTAKSHSNRGTNDGYLPDMSFIGYWNGAYNSSNNSSLTYAHQGTIQCKPTSLYSDDTGTTGTVTLSQTSANFSYLEIYYYRTADKQMDFVKVYSPDNKNAMLVNTWYGADGGSTNLYIYREKLSISGKNITRSEAGAGWFNDNYQGIWVCGYVNITKVLGYK